MGECDSVVKRDNGSYAIYDARSCEMTCNRNMSRLSSVQSSVVG